MASAEQIGPDGQNPKLPLHDRLRNRATRAVTLRRHRFLIRAFAFAARLYLEMVANVSYELALNGELRVLQLLSGHEPRCIFDVGSNVGDWALAAVRLCPRAQVHAFEIVPETAQHLRDRLERAGISTVTVNPVGLADRPGTLTVSFNPDFPAGATAAVAGRRGTIELRDCAVQTGDDYCRDLAIEHIDVLKIDVEGLEARVLAGFAGMLESGLIDVVQFEYGRLNASVRVLLGEIRDGLEGHGYAVGKVYPDGVDFRDYNAWTDEDFLGPVYLAVHRRRGDLISLVAATA